MTPEQKFKQWALDPNGGGWSTDPTLDQTFSNMRNCKIWEDEQRAFLAGMEADRWISVEERLPEEKDADEFGNVLIHRRTNAGQAALSKAIYDYTMVKYCDKDTHWQPLPNKPKP